MQDRSGARLGISMKNAAKLNACLQPRLYLKLLFYNTSFSIEKLGPGWKLKVALQ